MLTFKEPVVDYGNFQSIHEYCTEQGIVLHPYVVSAAEAVYAGEGRDVAYTACHAAYMAGIVLQRTKPQPLATRLHSDEPDASQHLLDETIAADASGSQLVRLINDSVAPQRMQSWDTTYFCADQRYAPRSSSKDEHAFDNVFRKIAKLASRPDFPRQDHTRGFELFTGESDRPVIVRVAGPAPRAVNLEEVIINGNRHPAGTILGLATIDEAEPWGHEGTMTFSIPRVVEDKIVVRNAGEIAKLVPIRLSLFAAPPDERQVLVQQHVPRDLMDEMRVVDTLEMSELRLLARQAVAELRLAGDSYQLAV